MHKYTAGAVEADGLSLQLSAWCEDGLHLLTFGPYSCGEERDYVRDEIRAGLTSRVRSRQRFFRESDATNFSGWASRIWRGAALRVTH